MCGIIAYIGKRNASDVLFRGLKILENRGYDSAGIATYGSGELYINKFASDQIGALNKLSDVLSDHDGHGIGIAHTRWATHGAKTQNNAHPHLDASGRFALVHNGVIENANQLRQDLIEKGFLFVSETDTEVIVQLLSFNMSELGDLNKAWEKTLSKLQGTWGLVMLDKEAPDELWLAVHGSPLAIGVNDEEIFIASEPSAFQEYWQEFIVLNDGEFMKVRIGEELKTKAPLLKMEGEPVPESPAPFKHWTLKEIFEQPEALSRAMNYGGRFLDNERVKLGGLEKNKDELLGIDHLVIVACGTSKNAGMYAGFFMRELKSFKTVQIVDASEMNENYLIEGSGVLAISQSGETKDVHRAIMLAKRMGRPVFSVVNKVQSLIARETGCGVYLNAGHELGVASTKAFTSQVTILLLIAIWFAQFKEEELGKRRELIGVLHGLPMRLGSLLSMKEEVVTVAENLKGVDRGFVLGKGKCEALAEEIALKIKEISYVHLEAYCGGALKHGPFALIEEGTLIILIMPKDENYDFMLTVAEEVSVRGARVIAVTDSDVVEGGIFEQVIRVQQLGVLTSLLMVLPMQLLAYYLSLGKGLNPDRPRNLAKAVTVD